MAGDRALAELSVGAHSSLGAAGLQSLPAAAQAPVSAALGRAEAAYRIRGLVAHNPAQRISARFARSGVAVAAGAARLDIALEALGRRSALRVLPLGLPVASAARVSYARGPVREWWANGPLGLEQGFDIARRPAGSGALTLSLAVSGSVRLEHGTVLLPGGLRYAGLRATDARGRSLHAWLQVRGGRVLVRVDDRGAVYPIRIDPLVQQQAELTPSDGVQAGYPGEQFGYSVATSGDTVVVGSPYHEANSEPFGGAVYVFHMAAAGWASATQTAELSDSTLGGNRELGFSVAISSDGHTIVAGAPAGSEAPPQEHVNPCPTTPCTQGTVDVFTTTSSNWTSTSTPNARLTVSGAESPLGGELGWSVAISGSTVVAGAPYDATAYPYTGLAYVFNEPGGGWSGPETQAAVLTASPLSTTGSGEDQFGWSVGISGSTIVVGAPAWAGPSMQNQGAAYVFTGPWSGTQTETATLTASDHTSNDQLGWSVAVSGNTVVAGADNHQVGSNQQGAAYVFVMPTGGWPTTATQTAELTASDGQAADELGWSVGISGTTIVAGARQAGSNYQGAAYAYTEPAGGWATTSAFAAKLTASDGDVNDNLGDSVAVSGTTIVAGAPRHNAGSSTANFGAVYVFGSGSALAAPVFTADTPPATGTVGSGYSYTFTASGNPAPSFAVASGALPAGLTLNASTGVLSGTPTSPGSSTFTIKATNGVSPDAISPSITVVVSAALSAPVFTADTPPATGRVGSGYSYAFTASGNPAPSFAVASGALPAGLTLNASTGVLSGTPTSPESSTFTIKATNGVSPDAISPSITITVAAQPPGPPDTSIVKKTTKKRTATFTFAGSGGVGARHFQCELIAPKKKGKKHPKPRFAPCRSPKHYKHLKPGRYTFKVRAIDATGQTDPAPAKVSFKIKS